MTEKEFELFLFWLNPDREQAAERYERVRRSLIAMFTTRGCHLAEDLVDQAFDQVARRLPQMIDAYEGDPERYISTTAKHLHLKYVTDQARLVALSDEEARTLTAPEPDEDKEREDACLQHCLNRLPPDQRQLVVEYYREQGQAKIERHERMAAELGISTNALRIRAFRLRAVLEKCLEDCLAEKKA